MPRHQLIQYKDSRFGLIFPAAATNLETLDYLLGYLVSVWEQSEFDIEMMLQPRFWDIACAVAAIIPSHPMLPLDMERIKDDPFLFIDLFLRGRTGGKSIIQKLHSFEPLTQRTELQPGENITLKHLPFPTCGDSTADQLAGVLYSLGLSDGLKFWDRFDAETLDKLSTVLSELNRPEDERIREFIIQKKMEWEVQVFGDDPTGGFMDQLDEMQRQVYGVE